MTSTLGREAGGDGSFQRQQSQFRHWVGTDGFPVAAGRYHLYVARACPWAHRTLIGLRLMGLEHAIDVSYVDPIRDERGWAFTGGSMSIAVNGFAFLSEAYVASDPAYEARVSVPVLWDREQGVIVNNESADIFRMLHTVFAAVAEHRWIMYPEGLPGGDRLAERVDLRRGQQRRLQVGFRADSGGLRAGRVSGVFAVLDDLDARVAERRFLFGAEPVETDWRLFTTLVRFDAVYQIHFKCSVRKLAEYKFLWPYARDLYQWPGVAETVSFDEIRVHYYRTHPFINPSGLVAVAPAVDWDAPPWAGGSERAGVQVSSPGSRLNMTVSRRPPLNVMCERSTPSRTKPHRPATRWERSLSGPQVSSSRATFSSSNAHRAISRVACVATPRPRAGGASQYPTAARRCSKSIA